MATEAQKRAIRKYEKANVKQKLLKFFPDDAPELAHAEAQGNLNGYVKGLIREDMERASVEGRFLIQKVSFNSYRFGSIDSEPVIRDVYSGTWRECMRYWDSHASGLRDNGYPTAMQDLGLASFYRIVVER